MENKNSVVPLILGIIGSVLLLPSMICNVLCAVYGGSILNAAEQFAEKPIVSAVFGLGQGILYVIALIVLAAFILGFIASFKSRTNPKASAVLFIIASVLLLAELIVYGFADTYAILGLGLYIAAIIFCFIPNKTDNPVNQ